MFDAKGKEAHAFVASVKIDLTPELRALARRNGFRITRALPLKPGIYQARIVVRETASDRIGSSFAWVEVPNLARSPYTLSSLFILTPTAGAPGSVADSRYVQGVRVFLPGKDFAYFFRIQKGEKNKGDILLTYQAELMRSGKSILQQEWLPVKSSARDSKGVSVSGKISLAGLPAGIYELRVKVKEPNSKWSLERTAIFGIHCYP